MYKRNPNRRNFNLYGNNDNISDKMNNSNDKMYAPKPHLSPYELSNDSLSNSKSYSYMKIKSRSIENDKNLKVKERFLYVILTVAIITALICTCLSIASMIMFFLI